MEIETGYNFTGEHDKPEHDKQYVVIHVLYEDEEWFVIQSETPDADMTVDMAFVFLQYHIRQGNIGILLDNEPAPWDFTYVFEEIKS